jgi:hypothetical protein
MNSKTYIAEGTRESPSLRSEVCVSPLRVIVADRTPGTVTDTVILIELGVCLMKGTDYV